MHCKVHKYCDLLYIISIGSVVVTQFFCFKFVTLLVAVRFPLLLQQQARVSSMRSSHFVLSFVKVVFG